MDPLSAMIGKLNAGEMLHFLNVTFLRKELVGIKGRFLRHLIAGGTGTLLYMISVAVMVDWMMVDPVVAVVLVVIFLEIYTYVVNRCWVYSTTLDHYASIPRFLMTAVIALLINSGAMYFVVDIMQWWYIWGLIGTILILPPTNFLMNYYWAFK